MPNALIKNVMTVFTPWWGKTLGAFFGYLAGGPAGAVLGILIGNVFDIGLFNSIHTPHWHCYRQAPQVTKELFRSALFKVMGHLAKTDGRVTEKDIVMARTIMREIRSYGREKRRDMQYFNDGKAKYFDLEKQLSLVKQACDNLPQLRQVYVEALYRCCLTHGVISIDKQKKLNLIFMTLGFQPAFPDVVDQSSYRQYHRQRKHQQREDQQKDQQHHQQRQTYGQQSTAIDDDYALLGINSSDRAATIKRAYRKKMSQIHPDKLIARGASDAEINNATEKAQRIQAAYHRIRQRRGF